MPSRNKPLQSLRVIRSSGVEVLCIVDADKTKEVQDAMRVIIRAAKTPIALSLVDVATGLPARGSPAREERPGHKGAVRP